MKYPVIMHINYMEQGQGFEEICRVAAKIGFDGIEFRHVDRNKVLNCVDYLDAIKKEVDKYGIRYPMFGGGFPCNSTDPEVRKAEIEAYKNFLTEASKRFNLTILNFFTGTVRTPKLAYNVGTYAAHGGCAVPQWQYEAAVEAVREVCDHAAKLGDFKLAFETHMGYIHDYPELAKKFCDDIDRDNIGVNLDYGNAVYLPSPMPLTQTIANCGKKLFYTHMKNSVPTADGRMPTSLSGGVINHREYVKALIENNFDGFIGIEAPRPGDRQYYAKEDYAYIRDVLDDLGC